ncbi:expressed unknown protein [Seminavis robusta]|uniref:Fatty acid hydroxylase domain-containing protein n=1 Tax=Seminavis robusta TaxID=568900 RepID=A0A9N8DM46_9STRA|nr:expressed unknown protein [Seminavis robusta]|eukprot:Sro201_g085200.1 n/a (301) ;mRNA; r:73590-74492
MPVSAFSARLVTAVADHVRFFAAVWLSVRWATGSASEDGHLTMVPWKTGIMCAGLVTTHTIMEMFYGLVLLGPESLASVKRQQVAMDIQNKALMTSLVGLILHLAILAAGLSYWGVFGPVFVSESSTTGTWMDDLEVWMMALVQPYAEFWAICVLKDCFSMNILHRKMHNKNHQFLHSIHELHHNYAINLNNINGSQIDPLDLFLENSIGPFLLVCAKWALGLTPQVSFLAFYTLVSSEGSTHSLNPYSVCYYFPPRMPSSREILDTIYIMPNRILISLRIHGIISGKDTKKTWIPTTMS